MEGELSSAWKQLSAAGYTPAQIDQIMQYDPAAGALSESDAGQLLQRAKSKLAVTGTEESRLQAGRSLTTRASFFDPFGGQKPRRAF